jgi:hypothetical protein
MRLLFLEKERILNGGRLSDLLIEELKFWADPKILYNPIKPEDIQLFEKTSLFSFLDGSKYHPKDLLELHIILQNIELTENIKKASELLPMKLLDYIIIGDKGYYSFCQKNIL